MNTEPIDVTSILAQPEQFAQRLRQAERERDNVIAQLSQARAEIARQAAELREWQSGRRVWVSPAELDAMIERRDPSLNDPDQAPAGGRP